MKTTTLATLIALGAFTLYAAHDHAHGHADCAHGHKKEDEHKHGHANCAHGHKHNHANRSHGHKSDAGHAHETRISVKISEAAARNAGIETVHPRKRAAGSEFAFKGRFELVPEARETIATPVAGKMELKTASLRSVTEGETLFTVTSPDILSRTKEIEILEKRLAVYREIKTPNARLENSLSLKKAELESILMGCKAEGGRIEIKSPKAGLVEEILELNGTWLKTGDAVLKLADTARLRFKGLVAADDAKRLADGMKAEAAGAHGEIRLAVGEESGLVPVYVVFEKPPRTIAGLRDTATAFTVSDGKEETAVPDSAIVEIDLVKHVFVRDGRDKNRFIAISVSTGSRSGGWTAVKGLPEGHCEVVSKGAHELRLAASSSGKNTAGHFHADGTFHEGEH